MLEPAKRVTDAAKRALNNAIPSDPGNDHDCEGCVDNQFSDFDASADIPESDVEPQFGLEDDF